MKTKSVVNYTLDSCVRCFKCIKACPTGALSKNEDRVEVNTTECINCGRCIQSCHTKGILAHGSTLADIENYEYTVCLVPSALISHCNSLEEAQDLFHAISLLGFDEVIDVTDIEAQLLDEANLIADNTESTMISAFCPVVNHLIEKKHSILSSSLLTFNYSSEIAAKSIRQRLKDKHVGIFNLCECEAKLECAKFPSGHTEYEVDHALALADVFPAIRKNMGKGKKEVSFNKKGLQACNPMRIVHKDSTLVADGFDKVNTVIEMSEFGLLNDFKLIYLFPCFNGCIGGHMLWGNSFSIQNNIDILGSDQKPQTHYPFEDLISENMIEIESDDRPFAEKMKEFNQINSILEQLPGYDCSACGVQTCRQMAQEILAGNKQLQDCQILTVLKGEKK